MVLKNMLKNKHDAKSNDDPTYPASSLSPSESSDHGAGGANHNSHQQRCDHTRQNKNNKRASRYHSQPWNTLDPESLRQKLARESVPRRTLSFYAYTPLENPVSLRDQLYGELLDLCVLGRIYLADEGINAQVSVPEDKFEDLKVLISERFPRVQGLNLALEERGGDSFLKLIIKVRGSIVAHGRPEPLDPSGSAAPHLDAPQWHKAMDDPRAVVVDVRNAYEHEVGYFEGSVRWDVDTFRELCADLPERLAPYKNRRLLLYCTGGIRCEKVSVLLSEHGFKYLWQLGGGIIRYKSELDRKLPGEKSRFLGKNFVFDGRLGERVTDDVLSRCYTCGTPYDEHRNCNWVGCHTLYLQCPRCVQEFEGCCSEECQSRYHLPTEEQKALIRHIKEKPPRFKSSGSKL